MNAARVLLRAKSGVRVGRGHLARSVAVAEALRELGARPLLVLDGEAEAGELVARGFEAIPVHAEPSWTARPAVAAWLDGFVDWSEELRQLARRGTPGYVVENRTPCREFAHFVVHPNLDERRDAWERVHAERVLAGARWIPLARSVLTQAPAPRELDLLVTFGGSDPLGSTERVLRALPRGLRVAVSVGTHMEERRAAIAAAARHLDARVLDTGTPLAPWMARAQAALTALGTTLYELAYLGTPAFVLANFAADRPVLERYAALGPFRPLGLAPELSDAELAHVLARALAAPLPTGARLPGLGDGARALAEHLLAHGPAAVAA